jgi:hypothetical protein
MGHDAIERVADDLYMAGDPDKMWSPAQQIA